MVFGEKCRNFTFLFDGYISGDSTSSFINEGTLTVPVGVLGVYPAWIVSPFTQTSTGSAMVEAGTLILGDGGTISGPVTVDTGAALYFGSTGSYSLDSSSSVSGAGTVVATGPVTDDGVYDISGTTAVSYGSLTFPSDATVDNLGADLQINNGAALSMASNRPFAFSTMSIERGTLNGGGGNLTVTGSMTWDGGTISGFGTLSIPAAATLALGDPSAAATSEVLNGVTLDNAGGAVLTSPYFDSGYGLVLENGAVFDNQSTGTFTFLFDGYISGDSTSSFINEGTLTVPVGVVGAFPAWIVSPFTQTSTGSTMVEAGTLILGGGGTISGHVTVDAGATIALGSSGDYVLNSSSIITGAGTVVATGPVTDDGVYDISGTTAVSYGSLTFPSDATIDNLGADLQINNGAALSMASNRPFAFSTMSIEGGTLNGGGGNLTVTGSMTWDGGTISRFGALTISGQAAMTLEPGYGGTATLDGVALDNYGTATWTGGVLAGADSGAFNNEPRATFDFNIPSGGACCYTGLQDITLNNYGTVNWSSGNLGTGNGVFNNESGATFDAEADGQLVGETFNNLPGATFVVDNDGQNGGTAIAMMFNNAGTVELNSGDLQLGGGSGLDFASSSGTFDGAPGTKLQFDGNRTLTATSAIDAADVAFKEANVNDAGTYAASGQTLLMTGAHVNFTGTVVSVGSSLDIVPSNADAFANFSPATPVTLTISECTITGTLTGTDNLVITGPLNWSGGTLSTTGTIDAEAGMTITGGSMEYGTLNNHGTATCSGSIGVGDGATINNLAGATFDVAGDTSIGYGGGDVPTFNNAGSLISSASGGSFVIGMPLSNSGSVSVEQGELDLTSATNSGTVTVSAGTTLRLGIYTQTAGGTVLNGGTINGGTLSINAGALTGSGTINSNVTNAGQVNPGGTGAAGLLTINGSYTQTSNGALDIELGGTAAGSIGRLAVSGTASLGGTLNVLPINNFHPAIGNSFQVLTFGSSANVADSNGLVLGQGSILSLAFGASSAILEVGDPSGSMTVTNTNDAGPGSLRQAILNANAHPAADTITFAAGVSGTIALSTLGEPDIADNLTINGPVVQALTISGNGAVGVFQVDAGVTATLSDLTISGGSATNGGGIDNAGTLTVIGSTITNNNASNNGGGIENTGFLTVTGSTIANNNAGNNGGGIDNSGTLTVTGSTISSNAAGNNGGGIENTGTLTLTDSTVGDNNTNIGNGGGIDNAGTMTAINTTIAYNVTGNLGALYDEPEASATLDNTIIALNSGAAFFASVTDYAAFVANASPPTFDDLASYDIGGSGQVSSASANNLIGTGGSGGLSNGINGNQVGVANTGLARLANNGGSTQTIGLLPGSPAIDAGSNAFVPTGVNTDQRGAGFPRIINGTVDIGAFESPVVSGDPTVYTVNLTSDTGAFNGTNAATATSGDLLWAVSQANANTNPAGSQITFNIPTSDPSYNSSTKSWTIFLTSTLDLSEQSWPEVIQGPGAYALTISGNNAVTVFQVNSATTATISGLTITGGNGGDNNDGGGITNYGTAMVTDCTIENNSGSSGGGIYSAPGFYSNLGLPFGTPNLTVTDSTITDNAGQPSNGGGGIFSNGVATITNSTITNNSDPSGEGGGIWNLGLATVTDSTIAGNVEDQGGGIENDGVMTMAGCAIDYNTAFIGGGIGTAGGVTVITDSTIAHNSASIGGGIWGNSPFMLTNSTIAYNSASTTIENGGGGGGLSIGDEATLDNTIVALNTDPSGPDDLGNSAGVSPASENSLVGVDKGGNLTNGVNRNIVGSQADPIDPLLGPLANNGGPTETIALLPGSLAIDTGSNALAVDPITGMPLTTDQRGALRGGQPGGLNAGSTVDIGAYEASSSSLVTSTAPSTDVGTLQTAIGWANVSTNANPANTASPAPNTIVFAPPDTQSLDQDLAAISSLAVSNSSPLPITIDLSPNTTYQNIDSGGNTVPIDATAPTNVALTLNGPPSGNATLYDLVTSGAVTVQGNITVIGNSPALVVNSGLATIANGVTLATATNAPTIQVNGGTLVVRDSTVEQNSTASSQPAILVDGGTVNLGTATSPGGNTLNVNGTGTLIENTTSSPVSAVGDTFESKGTAVASTFGVVTLSAPPSQSANQGVPQSFSLGSLTDTVTDAQSWTVDVNWGDNSGHTDFNARSTGPLNAQPHAFATPGTYTVTVTVTDPIASGATAWDFVQSFTVMVAPSIFVLDPSAGGALSLSGNASLKISGAVVVDSSSKTSLSASGNSQVKASVIDVYGGVQKSASANFSPAATTGAPILSDPLLGLTAPTYSGTPISENLSGSSKAAITPGVYSQITVSGSASLTLCPGVYVIAGGGLSVSGNASVTGTGVMFYNTKSSTGTYGGITLSGNGAISLTAPTTGTYAGILIFQDRASAKALTFSGNAMQGITGTIYAPAAQLAESGNAQIGSTSNPVSIIVDTLTISGNGIANTVTLSSPSGTVAYTPAQIRAAYDINGVAFDGTGQTIAIVDAYDDPSIYQALDAFDSQFGLTTSGPTLYNQYEPSSSFLTVLNQNGQATSLPSTDPNGLGTDNWEVEEALDVEWAHAIAPGAQIILVEANSQSLSDLMASVAAAASQPGVSVVSMSWGFAEGRAVFASDEAHYNSVFNVPGVTFVASTGDYGTADPEYPAFSPNVVAVGGTSLALNANNSYNSETGWGYYSSQAGAMIASGGGISLYEPEPAYQQGVQSTGYRSTPDVSLVADPATGAWIADPYNLDPSNPFQIVGGTSLSAPAWAGLLALVNQGRAAAGESTLNSTSPTDTQQALYMLPQTDYNMIASGNNGYSAGAGYNLVTGLGTPVANQLVPDLIAYHGTGTAYSGPTVAPMQNAGLVNTGTSDGGPMDVFSVFDSLTVTGNGLGDARGQVFSADLSAPISETPVQIGSGRNPVSPLVSAEIISGPATNFSPVDAMPLPPAGVTMAPVSAGFMIRQTGWSPVRNVVNAWANAEHSFELKRADHDNVPASYATRHRIGFVADSVLNALAIDAVRLYGRKAAATDGLVVLPSDGVSDAPMTFDVPSSDKGWKLVPKIPADSTALPRSDPDRRPYEFAPRLAMILLAAGSYGYGANCVAQRSRRIGRLHPRSTFITFTPRKM